MQPKIFVKCKYERGENMKFGDKLIALRKKNGLSQEELAEKLNVSRQSVSKWESNNTYPETEKIVLICNLFNCSMDELINDKITDIEQFERKEKNNLNIIFDSLLEFITKTVDMFAGMTFGSGFKCVIELLVVAFILFLVGSVGIAILSNLLTNLFGFIQGGGRYAIVNFVEGVLSIVWFILSVIVLVHVFKIRYLDYFERVTSDDRKGNDKEKNTAFKEEKGSPINKEKIKKEAKPNIIIRDAGSEPFAFLSILSKIVIYFIKFCAVIADFWSIIVLFGLIVAFVVLIPFCLHSMLFAGINVAVLASIVITTLVTIALFKFITGKKVNLRLYSWIFLASIVVAGIGSGIGALGLKDIEVKEMNSNVELATFEDKIFYSNDIYIDNYGYDIEYLIDNTIPTGEIKIMANYDNRLYSVHKEWMHEDKMNGYFLSTYSSLNFKKVYDLFIKDLKNNVIRDYSSSKIETLKVIANEETLNKVMANTAKIYLFDKEKIDGGYKTSNYDYKVTIDYSECEVSYNAIDDAIDIDSKYCSCERKTVETSRGTRIWFSCESTRDDDYYDE